MAAKRFLSIKLHAKHQNKRKYHLDTMEGGHRRAAIFQANFGAQLNPEDGSISSSFTYAPEDFRTATVTLDASITAQDIMGAYNSTVEQCSMNKGFLFGKCTVQVEYLSNKDVALPQFLEACQICSEGIGREKRNSASKDVSVELAKCTESFLDQMSDNELMHRPCLEQFDYPSPNKFPKTILIAGELTQTLHWQTDRAKIRTSLPLTDFLYTEVCKNYCKSPFDKDNIANFKEKLKVPCVLNEKKDDLVSLKPPFVISYVSVAVDAGRERNNVLQLKC